MDHQQARSYNWTWTPAPTKRKLEFSAYDSWEEQAFAEDAAGLLGSSGCVWPPRSYTCSFCRREFRSAQALGGHMNVHRRDRARLKQLPNTPQDHQTLIPPFNNETHSSPFLKDGLNYKNCPSNPNPNNPLSLVGHSKNMQRCNLSSPSPSNHNYHHKTHDNLPNAKVIEVIECREDAKSELSISLNLVVRRNRPEEDDSCIKRRKIVTSSPEESPPLIFSSEGNNDVDHKVNIVPTNHSSSSREIDLELRLGV